MKRIILWFTVITIIAPAYTQMEESLSNYSPLHWAAAQGYVEMMKVLADKGYDINAQDANGFTPLHYAAAAGSFQGVEFLVGRGADVYLVNKKNVTPMTLAAQAGEQKIVDFLFVKMRSMRVDQLRAQAEKERINTDLVQAAKARAEAERLRQQAADWTTEAEYWRVEAEKWTREANLLKDQQIQIDQLAKERYEQIIQEKSAAEENFKAERLARTAAERLLREQSANTTAQIRAYEAQVAALAAQRATDAAIENLAEEFIRQGMANPQHYNLTNTNNTDYISIDTNVIPVDILTRPPAVTNDYSIQLEEVPTPVAPMQDDTVEMATMDDTYDDYAYDYDDYAYDENYGY
ncbi:MAG: ankyrin repeat domain-containing protein [Brevinema sp.]